MNILSSHNLRGRLIRHSLVLFAVLTFATPSAEAQTTGKIVISGKVYGGGKQGAIGINNVKSGVDLYPTTYTADEANAANAGLDGAISQDVALTAENVAKVNAALGTSYSAGDKVNETEANTYNATLPGAIAEGTKKQIATKEVQLADGGADVTVANVIINEGEILAVFGGGEKGRSYGKTSVTIQGDSAQIGLDMADAGYKTKYDAIAPEANKLVCGNAFGAGDGAGADVFGGTHVLITSGTINGSVYGGGNHADLIGSTQLTLQGGKYVGAVFGGAKQADIFGRTYVHVDGEKAKNDLHIIDVYGGNDIAGHINPADAVTYPKWTWAQPAALATLPFTLADTGHLTKKPADVVDGSWNAFILATNGTTKKTLIDNIYGGGNGDYDYTDPKYAGLSKPVIDRTYLQIEGGMYGSLYGGGNAATVAVSTDICLVNSTDISTYLGNPADINALSTILGAKSLAKYSPDYQFNRVFGGNNKEPMAIRPNWYLEKGEINNLYSGGNAGPMTYFKQTSTGGAQSLAGDAGILIHVQSNDMTINNVYGGCRMADVDPNGHQGADMTLNAETIDGYSFPRGYAARVLIEGGNINNVYGGNDVSGNVYYGSLVEVHSSINGNVYGAGNGSYAYTDNVNLKGDKEYGDYYYDGGTGGLASAKALSKHRPNAEQSYVHVTGTESKPTYIGGAIYCGGNSATLRSQSGSLTDVNAELHIGSYVIADNVFLGSNGENMVKSETADDLLQIYKNGPEGYDKATKGAYSTMDLTVSEQFEEYMSGVEVAIKPTVSFDADYVSHSTKFGSLYCGGNVGSMSADGYFNLDFLKQLVIYNKLVGGCNNANVAKTGYNAFHMGGLTGAPDANNNKVLLTIAGLQLEPRVLTGNVQDGFSLDTWNKAPIVGAAPAAERLVGGNIYGGCYSSGYINGGVNIDIQQNAISPNVFAAAPAGSGITYDAVRDDVLASTLSAYGGGYGKETEIWGNVTVSVTGNGQIMKAYGGGEMGVVGKLKRDDNGQFLTTDTLEWYPLTKSTTVCDTTFNVSDYASRPHTIALFEDGGKYNTTVNLNAAALPSGTTNNVAKLYAGGFQGTVSGNTTLNLNRGRAYDAFGGASNADILGHAETYIGKSSAPTITHNVYGANDFGGLIVGTKLFEVDNKNNEMEKVVAQTYVEYNSGHIGDGSNLAETHDDYLEGGNLFGGPCGAYEYDDDRYFEWDLTDPANPVKGNPLYVCKPMLLQNMLTRDMLVQHGGAGYGANSFVNIISPSTAHTDYIEGAIFGAGQGKKGRINSADERGSYVRLASATTSQRTTGPLSRRVYGAGYCSNTNRSLIDAYTGNFGTIFGAAHGISYEEVLGLISDEGTYETNYMGYRSAVRLHDMVNRQMDIYGGGANASAQETGVVLNGGQARNVYGASFDQGITYAASVEIPETSTSRVNAIFGGAKGKNDTYPCDVYNTFVTWNSANARVNDAIYGGNDAYRMTRNSYISVTKPVKDYEDKLTDVFGGGFGENTVTLYTSVGLQEGAEVANVYGGGNNGQVLDTPSFRYYLDDGKQQCADGTTKPAADGLKDYPEELLGTGYGYQKYLKDTEVNGFHTWIMANYWNDCRKDDREQPLGSYTSNAHGHAHDLYFLSTQMKDMKNTNVYINRGALVAENAYGGGFGDKATVSGETSVKLWGGTVKGDIYGGGYGGDVAEYPHLIYPAGGQHELTMSSTHVYLQGGIARNVYGGGLNGHVEGYTDVVLGTKDQHEFDFYGTTISGENDHRVIYGDPIVERSLYGGGQNGHVNGTAYLTINQGHVGYKYDPDVTIETTTNSELKAEYNDSKTTAERKAAIEKQVKYVENLDLNNEGDNFLDQNGNAFGAGYGERASVDVTYVNIYGGTIRNSLYGGGEIATVGRGVMANSVGANKTVDHIDMPGRTNVFMYKGLVQGDVFGGGRGFSYDLTGNEVLGKEIHTEGYVFGTTNVEIRGGIVGTEKSVANGHGNVFGGGNIGYCFTDAVKRGKRGDGSGEGRYYTNAWKCDKCGTIKYEHSSPTVCGNEHCKKSTTATDATYRTTFTQVNADGTTAGVKNDTILSEDCRVVISPWAQVTAAEGITITGNNELQPDGTRLVTKTFAKGDYVPTAYLDLLRDKNSDKDEWAKVSSDGVIVRNAVFAGGNVSSGSDKVYANAYTVFGNATASVNDVYFRDFITLGTEHIGGLYGDGNLTFVDGYRELNITNFGTDYYGQQDYISLDMYNNMNDRERAYFRLEYKTTTPHTYSYYTCTGAHEFNGTTYIKGQQITSEEYNRITTGNIGTGDKKNDDASLWQNGSTHYNENDRITEDVWALMTEGEKNNWTKYGFCSIFAGRLLNTIQRADFCGVFGSRLVLQGAQDRVPEVVDYTQYTINRVGELSLNMDTFKGTKPVPDENKMHGNYIGFYNVVNYLGALTSDVKFDDERTYDNSNGASYAPNSDGETYYQWKNAKINDRKRNNGTCHNMVALASGVYLEIVKEPVTPTPLEDTKDPYKKNWGYITGIVQLDLINVMQGLGGGYVYAKNEHGKRTGNPGKHDNLSIYNKNAVNNTLYTYDEANKEYIETSGNFIHNLKQIVDDCYPAGGAWNDYEKSPAHYWYIRGAVYVYDQYISAFTGSTTAYSENINLPLTITAGANGRLDLVDIKPNYYAYYQSDGTTKLSDTDLTVVNNKTYAINDVITYWDYMQLTDAQKAQFVDETYVCMKDYCTSDQFDSEGNPLNVIKAGEVILKSEYETLKNAIVPTMVFDAEDISQDQATGDLHMKQIKKSDLFHVSNAVSHDNGYVLGVSLSNPVVWDNWYSPQTGYLKLNRNQYNDPTAGIDKNTYTPGPTFYTETAGLYGQREYIKDDIISGSMVATYNAIPAEDKENAAKPVAEGGSGRAQAIVAPAYVAIAAANYEIDGQKKSVQQGIAISFTEFAAITDAAVKAKFAPAYVCNSTYEEDAKAGQYIYFGELIPDTKRNELISGLTSRTENPLTQTEAETLVNQHFDNAYIVTSENGGWYGGQHFAADQNYTALSTWATLSADDREHFKFRYDALDALALSNYPGTGKEATSSVPNNIDQYDGKYWDGTWNTTDNTDVHQIYGAKQAIDYTAEYRGTSNLTYGTGGVIKPNDVVSREVYEALPNEQRHYSHFKVADAGNIYIVKTAFVMGNTNYPAGRILTVDEYNSLGESQSYVVTFNATANTDYYICREQYTIANNASDGHAVSDISSGTGTTIALGGTVNPGVIIAESDYSALINKQKDFTVHGESPIETSTFYVNRESNIYDLSKERIITVVYQYKYEESDESGKNIEEITERHVVNIHIEFKSGVPTIGQLQEPSIVLPGDAVGLKQPNVTPGAYELLGGGWELFTNPEDAAKHQNGKEYINSATPMYWYQDGYWVAYYSKTYLGKTYSNAVQFKVANYHDIADVMADTENYMYIDHPDVHRNSKIYIDNSYTEENPTATKSEIDMLYDLFQKSLITNEKTIKVDVQDKNGSGELLYYAVNATTGEFILDAQGNRTMTTEETAFPVTHKEDKQVPTFDDHVRNLANLDFYLSDDVATKKATWTPIGWDDPDPNVHSCFMGTLHGMGHTISGLDHSLFGELCGYVYNLGVTGSFDKSGVADKAATGTVPGTGDPENGIPATQIHGYVNSSWIYTTGNPASVGSLSNPNLPVVGTPNNSSLGLAGMHVHNCYFPIECDYVLTGRNPNETANSATLMQFNNGEVAHDLNGWYLNKRYQDAVVKKSQIPTDGNGNATGDAAIYKFWRQDQNGNLIKESNNGATEGYYIAGGSMHAYNGRNLGYVERLYADGDFVYRNGTIPLETNERYSSPDSRYVPIWPDDYYFFGQQLTYGYDEKERPYQPLPSAVRRTPPTETGAGHDRRIVQTNDNNLVYRIPAYFRSSVKKWAHFNPYAVFADHMKKGYALSAADQARGLTEAVLNGREIHPIHPGLTAIDFTAFNDRAIMGADHKFIGEKSIMDVNPELVYSNGARNISGKAGYDAKYAPLDDDAYFAPITDYTTLAEIKTFGVTQNLLAYAPTHAYSQGTSHALTVLEEYFNEPVYADHYSGDKYRKVDALDPSSAISSIHGHLVKKENTTDDRHYYYAASDHFLVDKQDFNAPIEYEFIPAQGENTKYRMWYQRTPDNYADMTKGWEGVSIPFQAELVTTQDKGEITHFYETSTGKHDDETGKSTGHEYWLREFKGISNQNTGDAEKVLANMNYPAKQSGNDKTVGNTFLWDYYYNADGKDANLDDYRHDVDNDGEDEQDRTRYYYGQERTYKDYPLSVAGMPYIAGFPSDRYYEFDLSGEFEPEHSGDVKPQKLDAQTITFVSETGIKIAVSDTEHDNIWDSNFHDGYVFSGNYLNWDERPDNGLTYFILNKEGSAYEKVEASAPLSLVPFRPFFAANATKKNAAVRRIVFGASDDTKLDAEEEEFHGDDEEQKPETADHRLRIYTKKGRIIVESTLEDSMQVNIFSASGAVMAQFTIAPYETVVTPVTNAGVYIVNRTKVVVK